MTEPTFTELIDKPTVVNIRHTDEYDVYVGRASTTYRLERSKWANPFWIEPGRNRAQAIEEYRRYIAGRQDLLDALGELTGKALGCWCHPLPCHADVLVELWEGRYGHDEA